MKNDIPIKQNEPLQIERLAAQREIYSVAKRLFLWQVILTVVGTIAVTLLVKWKTELQCYAAVYAVAVALLNELVISQRIRYLKGLAARTQELFDVDVLSLSWNSALVGSKPGVEDVVRYSSAHKRRHGDNNKLQDWYHPSIGSMDLCVARLICQRSSASYDEALRQRYIVLLWWACCTTMLGCTLVAMWGDLSLRQFLLGMVVPSFPAFLFFVREITAQQTARKGLERLTGSLKAAWDCVLAGNSTEHDLTEEARQLQVGMFLFRSTCPLVPDWLYQRLRPHEEAHTASTVEHLVRELEEAKRKSGGHPCT